MITSLPDGVFIQCKEALIANPDPEKNDRYSAKQYGEKAA
jgi:hypothetical protein